MTIPERADDGLDEGIGDPTPDPSSWRWRDRSIRRQVGYAALVTAGVSAAAALTAELLAMANRDCHIRSEMACSELSVLIVFGVPTLAVFFLWQLLRLARVGSPGLVAGMTLVSLVLLAWADGFGVPIWRLATGALPWWAGLPLLTTALAAGWTALVGVLRRG